MQELLDQLSDYLAGIRRYRWVALTLTWLIVLGGWGYVAQLPNKFQATTRVHVDTNSVLRPLLRGLAIQPDVRQRVALMGKTLLSRPNMEKLIRMVDLDLQVKTDAEKEMLLSELQDNIKLTGTQRNSSIYTLTFVNEDRVVAKRVVQSLLSILIEGALGDKRQDSAGAAEFLDKQIAEYEVRLAEAEGRVADFKRRYVGSMPGDTGGYYQRLQAARRILGSAQLELSEAQNRRSELKRQLVGEEPVFIPTERTTESRTLLRLNQRIQGLQEQLDQLLLKYTDRHPDVIEIRAIMEDLESKKKAELDAAEEIQAQNPQINLNKSPVYQQMRAMLAETEARVAELTVRVGEYSKRAKALEDKVDQVPLIEAELQQLNRDYDAVSQQHAQLLKRRESANLSEKAEQESSNVNFRVIDPPFVPQEPTEPNKLLLFSGVFVVGIGAGVGGALVLSLLRPVFGNRRSLGRATGLPVLGIVTLSSTPAQRRHAVIANVGFVSMILLLTVAFAGVYMIQESDLDLMQKLSSLKAQFL